MKIAMIFLSMVVVSMSLNAGDVDSILNVLDRTIERSDTYFMIRQHRIDSIKAAFAKGNARDVKRQYHAYDQLFEEYKQYQSDSAKAYAIRLMEIATRSGKPEYEVKARENFLFVYISSGLFKEASDIAENTGLSGVSRVMQGDFYFLCIRLYSDLSNYMDGSFTDEYATLSHAYSDSVIACLPGNTYKAMYASIFKTIPDMNQDDKIAVFHGLLHRNDIDDGEKAMISSILADLYREKEEMDSAVYYKANSAILDIRSAKRETTSKRDLALWMYNNGDLDRAIRYIHAALDDANFYNARHRKSEISNVLPLIEQARYTKLSQERETLWYIIASIVIILVVLAVAVFLIVKQVKRLHDSRRTIEQRNREIQAAKEQIEAHNRDLQVMNARLLESDKIKDEFIGYGFYQSSMYVKKIEGLYRLVSRKLSARQYDDLKMTLKESDINREKGSIMEQFDRTFLRLFPTFIRQYGQLFPPSERKSIVDDGTLTPEMRIFALIRLGITDCNSIAYFLNFSVNTVNTYKTRVKNRSDLPNNEFEQAIMQIH